MIRVGVDASLDESLFHNFTKKVELVRLPVELDHEVDIDFWVAPILPSTFTRQLPLLRGVKVIQSLWAGIDTVLSLVPKGITLCDARGVHDIPTAEWAVMAILAMQKYLPFFTELQKEENWQGRRGSEKLYREFHGIPNELVPPGLVDEVADATVLIVGYGSIGKAIEARLTPFGCNFLRVARTAREGVESVEGLDEWLPKADVVVLIMPLTAETTDLIDARRIAKMKHGALLVNAARGPLVNTGALLQALTERRIRAAVDVTDPEPLPPGHPLWKAPNILITPHVAGSSPKFVGRVIRFISEQAERFASGEPIKNVVAGEY